MKTIVYTLSVFCLIFCSSAKLIDKYSSQEISSQKELTKDQIVYLFFSIKNNNGSKVISLDSKKVSDGKLKQAKTFEENTYHDADLKLTISNNAGKIIHQEVIEDPLNPTIESYDEEGMKQNKISLEQAEFFTRFSFESNEMNLKIETKESGQTKLLMNEKLRL